MARYLITGVTGSLGQEVTKLLLEKRDVEIVGYSRDELKQSQLKKHPRLTLYLGDVRDQRRLIEASRGVDVLFHFAALKRVDAMEENPEECIATNIAGTTNVLGAQRANGIRRVVLSSTDKAALPETVYGSCKMISERLVLRNPNNVVCRYGNVLASRGSVIASFIDSLLREKTVYITDPEMTRFFLTIQDAAKFVVQNGMIEKGGLKIPKLKACKITDLAAAIADILCVEEPKYKFMGIRCVEKIHECLVSPCEGEELYSNTAPQMTKPELVQIVTPIVNQILGIKKQKRPQPAKEATA